MVRGGGIGGELTEFRKQFFPRRVKLTLEGIDGMGGYKRSGEPVRIFYESC